MKHIVKSMAQGVGVGVISYVFIYTFIFPSMFNKEMLENVVVANMLIGFVFGVQETLEQKAERWNHR